MAANSNHFGFDPQQAFLPIQIFQVAKKKTICLPVGNLSEAVFKALLSASTVLSQLGFVGISVRACVTTDNAGLSCSSSNFNQQTSVVCYWQYQFLRR